MPVTKRLRYEILRRDNHTCRYCGAKAPNVELAVDHVTPKALGGSDTPDNLVTACKDCNTGKSSSPVDAPIVAEVSAEALRWATSVRTALRAMGEDDIRISSEAARFMLHWEGWAKALFNPNGYPYPDDGQETVERFMRYGMTFDQLDHYMQIAMYIAPGVRHEDAFRYFCGVCWKKIREAERLASES